MNAQSIQDPRVRNATVADVLVFRPPVGRWWPRSGGFCIGDLDHYTAFAAPYISETPMTWSEADEWARTLCIQGHMDFGLPALAEFELMKVAIPQRLGVHRYWAADHVPGLPSDAQTFDVMSGSIHWGRHHKLHAIAVRRDSTWRSP